ncbi:hypothetical protein M0R19_04875 [Candidatus Pacearchaeota archaeon]|nr:hypothetical protein [Candidatus Pacearchaeota archaeon]
MQEGIENYCKKCKWYKKDTFCKAYPDGIPKPIADGDLIHDTPWMQSDRPYVFEEKKSYTVSFDEKTSYEVADEREETNKKGRPKKIW